MKETNSSNPFLGSVKEVSDSRVGVDKFTVRGAINKTILGILLMIGMIIVINATSLRVIAATLYLPLAIGIIILMIVLGLQVRKDITKAKTLFWVYAVLEATLLSVVILAANTYIPGVGTLAGIITVLFVGLMAIIYNLFPKFIGKIAPLVYGAIFVIGIIYLINLVFLIFGGGFALYNSVPFAIILLLISAFSVATDFRAIDIMEKKGLSKDYEYLGAFGLLTSIVWLYWNVLRLLLIRNR